MIRCIPVHGCTGCPYKKRNYGVDECSHMNFTPVPKQEPVNAIMPGPPDWCPLPPHPSFVTPPPPQAQGQQQGEA